MLYGWYEGNTGHNILLEGYNYTTSSWVAFTGSSDDFPSGSADEQFLFTFPGADYVSGNIVKLRLDHVSPGSSSHKFYIDEFVLLG